jgi:hypothetical protein
MLAITGYDIGYLNVNYLITMNKYYTTFKHTILQVGFYTVK